MEAGTKQEKELNQWIQQRKNLWKSISVQCIINSVVWVRVIKIHILITPPDLLITESISVLLRTALTINKKSNMRYKGLGDVIEAAAKVTGMDKVATFVAKKQGKSDCGCSKRKDTLNKRFPFKKND